LFPAVHPTSAVFTVPSLQTVGDVVVHVPLVGSLVVPLLPTQNSGEAAMSDPAHNEKMPTTNNEIRADVRVNTDLDLFIKNSYFFLFNRQFIGNDVNFIEIKLFFNSDKDMK
jgi:hypothetical protein